MRPETARVLSTSPSEPSSTATTSDSGNGVRGELEPPLRLEAVDGLEEREERHLGEVLECLTPAREPGRECLSKTRVRGHDLLTQRRIAGAGILAVQPGAVLVATPAFVVQGTTLDLVDGHGSSVSGTSPVRDALDPDSGTTARMASVMRLFEVGAMTRRHKSSDPSTGRAVDAAPILRAYLNVSQRFMRRLVSERRIAFHKVRRPTPATLRRTTPVPGTRR
jgi:hypothetical protein